MKSKVNATHQAKETKEVLTKLDGLHKQVCAWTKELNRTNASLYELLAQCLEIYYEIKGKNIENLVIKSMVKTLEDRGFVVSKSLVAKSAVHYGKRRFCF